MIGGKPATSASSFGRVLTDVDLTIDRRTEGRLRRSSAQRDRHAGRGEGPGPAAILDKYTAISAPIANRMIGSITRRSRAPQNAAGESALGDMIADSQLAATAPTDFGGAVVAFMNPGGIRTDLTFNNQVAGEHRADHLRRGVHRPAVRQRS